MRTRPSMARSEGNMVPAASTGLGIASRGQEKPATKSCGRLVPRKMSVGVSGCLNQAPTAWPMKLVARTNTDASAKNCKGWQKNGQMRDPAAEHARERSAQTLRQRDHGQH